MRRTLAGLLGALLLATPAIAQRVSVDGKNPQLPNDLGPFGGLKIECMGGTCGGGGGGAVDQGASNVADPWYVRFAAAQHFICDGGTCGGASAFLDSSAFTAAVSAVNPIGCVYDDGIAALAAGQAGAPRCTSDRRLHVRSLASGTDKVDVRLRNAADGAFIEPATDRTTAVAPFASRLTDGAAFYDARSIRALTFAGDKVDVSGSTLGANSGVDIGDVTINNGAGANAVNIQDGGNSITIDGTVTANQGTANATPWNENLAQVGGNATTTVANGTQKVGVADNGGNAIESLTTFSATGSERGLATRVVDTPRDASTTFNAAAQTVSVKVTGYRAAGISFGTSTCVCTVAFEALYSGATAYVAALHVDLGTGAQVTSVVNPSSNRPYATLLTGPITDIQARVSAYTSGSVTVKVTATNVNDAFALGALSMGPSGVAVPFDITQVGGTDSGGLMRATRIFNAQPASSDYGTVTREVNLPAVAALADGRTNPTASVIEADSELFNGTTWDREHGNWRTTTGDTGSKTVTFNGATQTNFDSAGALILVQLGTVSGTTPTLACQLQWSFDAGTTWLSYGAVLANLTATNQTGAIMVYPATLGNLTGASPQVTNGLTLGATVNITTTAPLPRTWRIAYTIGGTTPNFAITNVHVIYMR